MFGASSSATSLSDSRTKEKTAPTIGENETHIYNVLKFQSPGGQQHGLKKYYSSHIKCFVVNGSIFFRYSGG